MADRSMTVEVSTAEELMYQFNTAVRAEWDDWKGNSANYGTYTIKLKNDIDFNNSPYYFYENDFFVFYNIRVWSDYRLVLDGDGHTISNIYCFDDHNVFTVAGISDGGFSKNAYLEVKNVTIEAILNSAKLLNVWNAMLGPNNTTEAGIVFNQVTFNVKMYAIKAWYNPVSPTGYESSAPIYIGGTNTYSRIDFVACVFNFFLASKNHINTNAEATILIYAKTYNNHYGVSENKYVFNGCIFKLRNQTGKGISFYSESSSDVKRLCFYNTGFFYNELVKFTANNNTSFHIGYYNNYSGCEVSFDNVFFASFGDLDSRRGMGYCLKLFTNRGDSGCANSFYDKNKMYMLSFNGSSNYNNPGVMAALTTEQCKDRDKLSEIGYIFCEES